MVKVTKQSKEIWCKRGVVNVARDSKGRFVSWSPFKEIGSRYGGFGEHRKEIAFYGTAQYHRLRYSARYDFTGSGKQIRNAVALALNERIVPKPIRGRTFIRVSASEFTRDPYRYGCTGDWVEYEIESP